MSKTTILDLSPGRIGLWREFYERLARKTVYQSPDYIRALALHLGGRAELFIHGADDHFIYYPYFKRSLAGLPFAKTCGLDLSKHHDIVSSWYYGGPEFSTGDAGGASMREKRMSDFRERFHRYCTGARIVSEFVRFDPNLKNHACFGGHRSVMYNRETVYVDLTLSDEEIWKGYKGRCRTAVRKGREHPTEVVLLDPSDFIDPFYDMYRAEMIRKNAHGHYRFPKAFFEGLVEGLGEGALLFGLFFDGRFIGGTICLIDRFGVAYDYLTATAPEYWKYQINNILFHRVILRCKRAGARIYDFHGGRDGVAFFKQSFSSSRGIFYVGEFIHDDRMYDLLTSAKNKGRPAPPSGFFPAYRPQDNN